MLGRRLEKQTMEKRKLGKTGMAVTPLGYGSMGLRGPRTWGVRVVEEDAADRFLNQVLDSGINFIDTSPDYGICEQRIGDYISSRRSEYFLATKCGCVYQEVDNQLQIVHVWDKEVVRRNLETSLQRMKTDYVDVLQFHGGDAAALQQAGLIELLIDFKRQGVIRNLGVSTKIPNLKALIDLQVFDTFQIPYSCLDRTHHELISKAAAVGAGVIIRGGVAQGGPDAVIQRQANNRIWELAKLSQLVPKEMTAAQLLLRYTLSHPDCHTVIVGTCDHGHLESNIQAVKAGPLEESLYAEMTRRVMQVESVGNGS